MARIFLSLAGFTLILLGVNLALGLWIRGYGDTARDYVETNREWNELRRSSHTDPEALAGKELELKRVTAEFIPARRRKTLHVWVGIVAALMTMLVNAISVTYFIGTSRWCREVVDTYGLDPRLADRSARLKRRTFPWALGAMLTVVVVAALGAASDPGAVLSGSQRWPTPHLMAAVMGTAFMIWSFLRQLIHIGANSEVIAAILEQVRDIRQLRGLDRVES